MIRKKAAGSTPAYWQEILPNIRTSFPGQYSTYLQDPSKIEFVQSAESGVDGDPFAYIKIPQKQQGMQSEGFEALDIDKDGKIDVVFLVVPKIERQISEEIGKEIPSITQKTIHGILTDPNIQKEVKDSVKDYIASIYRHLILHELGHKDTGGEGGEASADAFAERFKLPQKTAKETTMLTRLVKLANRLDAAGQKSLADELDRIIVMAQAMFKLDSSKRYDYKEEDIFGTELDRQNNLTADQLKAAVMSTAGSQHFVAESGTGNFVDAVTIPELKEYTSKLTVGPIDLEEDKPSSLYIVEDPDIITGRPPSPSQTPEVIVELSKGTIKDKNSGDAFRAWMHEHHPAEAKSIKLDPPSSDSRWDNSYVLKALRMFLPEWQKNGALEVAKYNLMDGKMVSPANLPKIDFDSSSQNIADASKPTQPDITQQHMKAIREVVEPKEDTLSARRRPILNALSGMNPISIPKMIAWLDSRRPGQELAQLKVLKELAMSQGDMRDKVVGMLAGLPSGQRFHPEEAKAALGYLSANISRISEMIDKVSAEEDVFFDKSSDADDSIGKKSSINNQMVKSFGKMLSSKSGLINR